MRSSRPWCRIAVLAAVCVGLVGCVSVQPSAFPMGAKRPAKAADATVLLFKDAPPSRPFVAVAKLNVHIEKTFLMQSAFDEAWPKLQDLARSNGADAVMNVKEDRSRLNETYIYNVSATAIAFTN